MIFRNLPRRSLGVLGTLATTGLVRGADQTPAAPPPTEPTLDVGEAAPERWFTRELNRFGNQGPGWSGGDSTFSVSLTPRTSVLVFSDTFLGPVTADGSRSEDSPFINNSFVLVSSPSPSGDHRLSTVTGTRKGEPAALVTTEDPSSQWYWFGAGTALTSHDVAVTTLHFRRTGGGPFDFVWDSNAVARIDARDGSVRSLDKTPSDADIHWASWIEQIGDRLYVYGIRDEESGKRLFLARTPKHALADPDAWRFWTGRTWSRTEADARGIADDVADEVSVAAFRGGYLLITQDTSIDLNTQVVASWAAEPQGPFERRVPLFTMDTGDAESEDVYAYNAHEHPQWRHGDTLLVSYNVNSVEESDLYEDASIYRPRFVRIPVQIR